MIQPPTVVFVFDCVNAIYPWRLIASWLWVDTFGVPLLPAVLPPSGQHPQKAIFYLLGVGDWINPVTSSGVYLFSLSARSLSQGETLRKFQTWQSERTPPDQSRRRQLRHVTPPSGDWRTNAKVTNVYTARGTTKIQRCTTGRSANNVALSVVEVRGHGASVLDF